MVRGIEKDITHLASVISSIAQDNKDQKTILKAIKKELETGKAITPEEYFGLAHWDPKKGYQKIEKTKKEEKKPEKVTPAVEEIKKEKQTYDKYIKDQKGPWKQAINDFTSFFDFLLDATGIKSIVDSLWTGFKKLGSMLHTLLVLPIKGLFGLTKGVAGLIGKGFSKVFGGFLGGKSGAAGMKAASLQSETAEENQAIQVQQAEDLAAIRESLEPKAEKIKGGVFDKLKNLFGGKAAGLAASFMRMFGVGLIFGGILWMINDFVSGFIKGGITGGLTKAFLGEAESGVMGIMKNAGKYAMIGGGIGMLVGGPLGAIVGGLTGAAIGGLLNGVYQLIKGPGTAGDKIATGIFGGVTGPMATLFSGMKWASMGFLLGLPFGGPIGGLIGAGIGFLVGSMVNIVWQMLGKDGRKAVTKFFDKSVEWMGNIWNSIGGFFSNIGSTIGEVVDSMPFLKTLTTWFSENIIDPIVNFVSNIGSWIKNKFTNWWNSGDDKKSKKVQKKSSKFSLGGFGSLGGSTAEVNKIKKEENLITKKIQNSLSYWLEKIYVFISETMVPKIDTVFRKNLNELFGKMEALNMENRMWENFQGGGTPKNFVSKWDAFNKKMSGMSIMEKQALQNAMLNSVDNRTNIVNNVGEKRRQKLKRR